MIDVPRTTNQDLAIALDAHITVATRLAAWNRYETCKWIDAVRERGLRISNLDEIMQARVEVAMRNV